MIERGQGPLPPRATENRIIEIRWIDPRASSQRPPKSPQDHELPDPDFGLAPLVRFQQVEVHPVRHAGIRPDRPLIPRPGGSLKRCHPMVSDGENPDVDVIGPTGKVIADPDEAIQDRAGAGVVAGDQFPSNWRSRPGGQRGRDNGSRPGGCLRCRPGTGWGRCGRAGRRKGPTRCRSGSLGVGGRRARRVSRG